MPSVSSLDSHRLHHHQTLPNFSYILNNIIIIEYAVNTGTEVAVCIIIIILIIIIVVVVIIITIIIIILIIIIIKIIIIIIIESAMVAGTVEVAVCSQLDRQ